MGYPFAAPNGGEERLNRQFAGFLHYSLQHGPELLNTVHKDHPLSFSEQASVVANQDSPLPQYTEEGTDREIDWVISDEDKLVGYESKYGARLHKNQLRDELAKLRVNATDQEVALVVVTMHTTPVSLLERFDDEPVYWLSWYTVFRRLNQLDESELPPEQRPLSRMLQDLFEAENMQPFTGFSHHDKLQYRYFIRDLRQELVGTEVEQPGKIHTSTTRDPEPSAWRRLIPKRFDIPFVRQSRDADWSRTTSYLTVLVDTETHDVHVGVVFNLRQIETHEEYVKESTDALINYARANEMQLWASYNSLNQWKSGVAETDDPHEMRAWLEGGSDNTVRADETDYKKAIFVSECIADEPVRLVQEAKSKLIKLHEDLLISDEIYPESTLQEHE